MKKYIGGVAAVLVAVIVSAFSIKKPSTNSNSKALLYWYRVTYDASHPAGYIPNSAAYYTQGEKENITSPCPSGAVKDCLRGFTSALTVYPSNAAGSDQIKKPN